MGRISPGPTRWPPGAERRLVPAKSNLKPQTDWGAHGGNEYWRNLLDRLTISSVRLPDEAIYVPLGRKTPIGKPGWGSEAVPRTPWLGYGIQPVSGPLTPCTEGKTPVDAPIRAVKPRIGNGCTASGDLYIRTSGINRVLF